jgi:predicted solute-binding protein
MEKYEDQLAKMCIALNNFVKLARAYGISLDNVRGDQRKVIQFEKIRSAEDIEQFICTYVRDITKNMASNMTIQQATSYELMSGIAPRYLKDCVDKLGGVSVGAAPCATTGSRRLMQL